MGLQLMFDDSRPGSGIEVRGLSHVFEGAGGHPLKVLDDVSFRIDKGEFVSIVGPSGCGKSTLLEIVAGLQDFQSGIVTIGGAKPRRGNRDMGLMFARDCLLPWRSALENVALGLEVRSVPGDRRAQCEQWLNEVQLGEFVNALPAQLSQGMRQRVALARTFALEVPYLIMDEPFGALDAQTKVALGGVLMQVWEKHADRTVMFVTHDLSEAIALSDRVIVLSRRPGRIIADIRIELDRPRQADSLQQSAEFHAIYSELWGLLRKEVSAAPAMTRTEVLT
ncbi:NitT/TauT family transport system ATP-binding protein [Paralcaligenes ureilyticus]|uniref:NitT/TauT family transport system ATP-binding protein n=2 Tax=Paralcaligenes ureilyticus TaxID=627131 RepID=A0A4R3M281_9BURK|nr:NitT/TauT family transport system ATP-binding protein [Paralcaligenes ureilyticus]